MMVTSCQNTQERGKSHFFRACLCILITVIISSLPFESYSQYWGGRRKPTFWDNWSFNLNGGMTSFYGDLSIYDGDFMKKLSKESGAAFGAIGVKHFLENKFGFGGQILYGQLGGENVNSYFEASILEYNLHIRMDLKNLIFPYNRNLKLGATGYAGIGQFLFNSKRYHKDPADGEIPRENTGVPEFVYFFGFGGYYDITDRFSITVDMALRQAQNDALDVKRDNVNFDYYTYMSLGVTYKVKSLFKSGKGYKSKRKLGRFPMRRRG